jgi:hypothetical protein
LNAAQYNVLAYAVAPVGPFLVTVSTDTGPATIDVISNWQKLLAGAKSN